MTETTANVSTVMHAASDTASNTASETMVITGMGPLDGFPLGLGLLAVVGVSLMFPSLPRLFGGLMLIFGLLRLWAEHFEPAQVGGFGVLVYGGLTLWLSGHMIFRLRFGGWATRLGWIAWRRTPLALISPRDLPAG